jgi:hypothetical protein
MECTLRLGRRDEALVRAAARSQGSAPGLRFQMLGDCGPVPAAANKEWLATGW